MHVSHDLQCSRVEIKVKASDWGILIPMLFPLTNPLTCASTVSTHWYESSQHCWPMPFNRDRLGATYGKGQRSTAVSAFALFECFYSCWYLLPRWLKAKPQPECECGLQQCEKALITDGRGAVSPWSKPHTSPVTTIKCKAIYIIESLASVSLLRNEAREPEQRKALQNINLRAFLKEHSL